MAAHKTYIVSFRTLPNGSFKYMKGLTRGYYQLLEREPGVKGKDLRYKGVRRIAKSPEGIDGVSERSSYYIGDNYRWMKAEADRLNQFAIMGVL